MEKSPSPELKLKVISFNMPPLWRDCLSSAFRAALACTIVGAVTLFAPPSVQTLITFPAFSYVAVILLIINDAALGDSLRGCWLALYATVLSLGPAMLGLWIVGPAHFSKLTISLAVALAAFVVVLPSNNASHLVAKRISLGQIVLVYVIGYANGGSTDPIMHPIRLAASTALGVVACVLALLLPYPRLACYEVSRSYKLLTKNILKRLNLLVKAISEDDKSSALAFVSHAKSLIAKRSKFNAIITRYQLGMKWERLPIQFFRPNYMNLGEKLEEVDTSLRGMQLALTHTKSFPVTTLDQNLKHGLTRLEDHVNLTIKQAKHTSFGGSLTVPESNEKSITHFLQTLHTMPTTLKELPTFFFLFCAQLLHKKEAPTTTTTSPQKAQQKQPIWAATLKTTNFIAAFKYSLSLGLAVYMGLLYSKKDGFWAGLPVAVSYVSGREATLRAANVKYQGTVLGTVYGVLGWFVFERMLPLRLVALVPWFIFTSFLQRSKMYGPAGGISAVIGAVLVLGRENFGPPRDFAIARVVETFIGLACSIFVDLLFRPKRASTCAKVELSQCLATLDDSISLFSLANKEDSELEDNQKRLKMQVNELRKFVAEAEAEPNFWFLPFHSPCYGKLLESFSRLVDLLNFGACALKSIQQELMEAKESVNVLQGELGQVNKLVCDSIKCLEEISKMKSLTLLEKELEEKKKSVVPSCDLESGKFTCMVSSLGEDGIGETIESFLQRSREVVDDLYGDEGEREVKSEVVLSLSVLGFCLSAFMQEALEIEGAIRELVQWENPSSEVNLCDISCKIKALNN